MLLMHIVGARPNFMKAAPVLAAAASCPEFTQLLVHTGQHYDDNMSKIFFRDLELPTPDVNLEVGSGPIRPKLPRSCCVSSAYCWNTSLKSCWSMAM